MKFDFLTTLLVCGVWLVCGVQCHLRHLHHTNVTAADGDTIDDGEEGEGCTPNNWNFSWFKAGSVWYTETKCRGSWQQMMMQCTEIEPGRSTIATVRNKDERATIQQSSLTAGTKRWIGGVRIAQSLWYWFHYTGQDASIIPIEKFFWSKGASTSTSTKQVCTKLNGNKKCWGEELCHTVAPALCEIRC